MRKNIGYKGHGQNNQSNQSVNNEDVGANDIAKEKLFWSPLALNTEVELLDFLIIVGED
jgi:hypothetical protein